MDEWEGEITELLREDVYAALTHSIYAHMMPRSKRLMITKPRVDKGERKSTGGIIMPDQTSAEMAESGWLCVVLAAGDDCDPDVRVPGTVVVVSEFSGIPIMDTTEDNPLPVWVVGEGDVMCVTDMKVEV